MSRTLTGTLCSGNGHSMCWSTHGVLAYGAGASVVLLHAASVTPLATFNGHGATVVRTRWCPENYAHASAGSSGGGHMRLASADLTGHIIVWDVAEGAQHAQCPVNAISGLAANTSPSGVVSDLRWVHWQDTGRHLLLALYPPYSLVLWNADSGEKIWKKTYTDRLTTFCLDPFDWTRAAFVTSAQWLMLVDDLCINKVPSGNGHTFKVSSTQPVDASKLHGSPSPSPDRSSLSATSVATAEEGVASWADAKRSSQAILSGGARLIRGPLKDVFRQGANEPGDWLSTTGSGAASGTSTPGDELQPAGAQFIQLTYHPAVRHTLILVYSKGALFVNTETLQTTAQIQLDRHMSPLFSVLPCVERDAVYFVQENGCVTLRVAKYRSVSPKGAAGIDLYRPLQLYYEGQCCTESVRITKTYRPAAAALCPMSGLGVALVMSNGRVLLLRAALRDAQLNARISSIGDAIKLPADLLQAPVAPLKLSIAGVWSGLGQAPTAVAVRPPAAEQHQCADEFCLSCAYDSIDMAVGTSDGGVQLVDTHACQVLKELAVHSSPVKCLEWSGVNKIVSASYSQALSASSVVRNELCITDVATGVSKPVRPEADESPVALLRASHYNCYLAVAFVRQPLEIWDLVNLRLLRRMSRTCPTIIDMAWSGKHHKASNMQPSEVPQPPAGDQPSEPGGDPSRLVFRENLVVLDNENHLYHVVVKGLHVRDGREVNAQWATSSSVVAMAWKDDFLAFGDVDGRVSLWDLAHKQLRAAPTGLGRVRRVRFSRAPDDHMLVALHATGLSVWSAPSMALLHTVDKVAGVNAPGPGSYYNGLGWAGGVASSGTGAPIDVDVCHERRALALLAADGSLRVAPVHSGAPLSFEQISYSEEAPSEVFCPALLSAPSVSLLRALLSGMVPVAESGFESSDEWLDAAVQFVQRMDQLEEKEFVVGQLLNMPTATLDQLFACDNAVQRYRLVSLCLGETWEYVFWTIVAASLDGAHANSVLPMHLGEYWPTEVAKRALSLHCAQFDWRRAPAARIRATVDALLRLGQRDAAVQLLLGAEPSEDNFYADCLLACLVSSVGAAKGNVQGADASSDSGGTATESTVKLVATNLIASGMLMEGVQLLCLIGKASDACRYLQSSGKWDAASHLAKIMLSGGDQWEVLRRTADHYNSPAVANKTSALLQYVSLGHWRCVADTLLSLRHVECCAALLDSLQHRQLAQCVDQCGQDDTMDSTESGEDAQRDCAVARGSLQQVYAAFARHLAQLRCYDAAKTYCDKSGELGENLRKEIDLLQNDD